MKTEKNASVDANQEKWFFKYKKISEKHFNNNPDSRFDIGGWDCHEHDYKDGLTPQEVFLQDLYTDI